MKKLIIVDRSSSGIVINEILKINLFHIAALVVDNEKQKEYMEKNKKIEKVVTMAELDNYESTAFLFMDDISKYKGIELKVENALTRYSNDYQEKKYHYYMGLSFWIEIFRNNDISAIIINGLNHGLLYDGIPHDLAVLNNIPCYTINPIGYYKHFIMNNLENKILEIKNAAEIKSIKEIISSNDGGDVNKLPFDVGVSYKGIKGIFYRVLYFCSGSLGIEFFQEIKQMKFKKNKIGSTGFSCSFFSKLYSYLMMKKNRYYAAKMSVTLNNDFNEPYIYYPLQFEPEGTTNTRLSLESQLVIIKMLSETLPPKWKLYVKEHPHQYKLNNYLLSYFIFNGQYFKTKYFYKKLKKIPNVVFIKSEYNGNEITKNSKAIASTVGSVLLESIEMNKPILLFSELHPVRYIDDIFFIASFSECKKAMEKIEGGFCPDYTDAVHILNRYVLKDGCDLAENMRIITNEIKQA